MGIASRIESTIESWRVKWQATFKEWLASCAEWGMEKLFDAFEPGLREEIKPQLEQLKAIPGLPPEWYNVLDKATTAPSFIQFAALAPYLIGALFGLAMGAVAPVSRFGSYPIDKQIHSYRLDPMSVITAWRRDPALYNAYFDDLKDQGWSEERIEALKFVTLFVPSADEQTLWLAREVYEPDMISKYGLDAEMPVYEETDFDKVGVSPEQMANKWRAHWEHASWMQIVEMLHRGLITEDDVWEWFRLVEIVPFWRDKLIQTAYTWPTRVDVRRWWDMRTIDEAELRRLYSGMGYRGVNLDNYILWTKVYVAFPDLMARWTNGWITEDDVRDELLKLGMPYDRVNEMIQGKKKSVEAGQVDEGKALTKTEIYKGVKDGRITRDQGIDLIVDLNYNLAQAEYLLDVNVGALEGSPHSYEEFKGLTQEYRKAAGLPSTPVSEELKKAGEEMVRLTGDVKTLEAAVKEEERGLIMGEPLPKAATEKLRELQAKLHRAEAELAAAQTNYNSQVAQWKYSEAE